MNIPILILNGLTYGGLLFMGASGLTLIMGLMGIVNMAHGSYYLLGAYVGFALVEAGVSWYLAILLSGLLIAILSYLVRVGLFRFVMGQGMRMTMLTIGISMILADFVLWKTQARANIIPSPAAISKPVNLGFTTYPGTRLFILTCAVLVGLLLWFIVHKTRMGHYILAGADIRDMTEALGVNINAVFTFVFLLSGLLVGISGVLGATYASFTVGSTDSQVLSYSLVIMVLGGMGSLGGAAVGAVIVGVLDSFCKALVPNFTPTIIFGTVILILGFMPQGLFGKEGRRA